MSCKEAIPTWGDRADPRFDRRANKNVLDKPDLYWLYQDECIHDEWLGKWFDISYGTYFKHVAAKRVDQNTMWHLYNREYNPVTISFYYDPYYEKHCFRVCLHSVDDSSYNIWLEYEGSGDVPNCSIGKIKQYIDSQDVLSGSGLVDWLHEHFRVKDVDYN